MSDTEDVERKFTSGKTDKDRRNNLIVIFLSAILVIVVILFFIQRSEHSKIISSLNSEKESLQSELNEMMQSYDALKTDNDTLNGELFVARTRVKDLMVEIGQLKKASYSQISKYQDEVGSLRRIMRNYIVQVDSLNRRNQQLMVENEQVKQNYMEVESQNKTLQEEKNQLSQRVERASQLEALGLVVTAVNKKGSSINNREKAEKLVINFTLSKNVTAKRGNKNI